MYQTFVSLGPAALIYSISFKSFCRVRSLVVRADGSEIPAENKDTDEKSQHSPRGRGDITSRLGAIRSDTSTARPFSTAHWEPNSKPATPTSGVLGSNETKRRNKRMFGALMGHLGAAKSRLNSDKTIETQAVCFFTLALFSS